MLKLYNIFTKYLLNEKGRIIINHYLILGRISMLEKLRNVFIGNPLKSAGESDEEHLLSKSQALAMLFHLLPMDQNKLS